jgi:hypothetical protein
MRLPYKFTWSCSAMGLCVLAFFLCCWPILAATEKPPLRHVNLNTATAF